jgi:hypothetical protein
VVFETSLDEKLNQLFDRNVLIVKKMSTQKIDVPLVDNNNAASRCIAAIAGLV